MTLQLKSSCLRGEVIVNSVSLTNGMCMCAEIMCVLSECVSVLDQRRKISFELSSKTNTPQDKASGAIVTLSVHFSILQARSYASITALWSGPQLLFLGFVH